MPSCHPAHFHCDLLISCSASHSACVGASTPGWPDFTSWNIADPGQQWTNIGCTPNPAWHISHQIWVVAASFVFNWSVWGLMSIPAVNLWPLQQADSAFPSLSVSLALLVLPRRLLCVFLSLLLSAMQGTTSPLPISCFPNSKLSFW